LDDIGCEFGGGGQRGEPGGSGGDRGRSGGDRGEIGDLEDAGWSSEGWEHKARVQPTSSAVLAGAGRGSRGGV
jgi:hypothetical protein